MLDQALPYVTLMLLLLRALRGPKVRLKETGGNASHNALMGVSIRRADHPKMEGQSWLGVLYQEIAEWRLLQILGVLAALPFPALIAGLAWDQEFVGAYGGVIFANIGGGLIAMLFERLFRGMTDGLDAYGTNLEIFEGLKTNPDYFEQEARRYADHPKDAPQILAAREQLNRWKPFAKVFGFLKYRVKFMESGIE